MLQKGFKFILTPNYPECAPVVYLDEPVVAQICNICHYLEKDNRITHSALDDWALVGTAIYEPDNKECYNLANLLENMVEFMRACPPIDLEAGGSVEMQNFNTAQPEDDKKGYSD